MIGGIFRLGFGAAKAGGRAAKHMGNVAMDVGSGAARGGASTVTGNPRLRMPPWQTNRAMRAGERLGAGAVHTGRGTAGFVADELQHGVIGSTARAGARGAGRMFQATPPSATWYNPAGVQLTRKAKWAVGLGALGVGAGLGYGDFARGERMGMPTYNRMQELSYGGWDTPSPLQDDLGATGDLVFALNNLK